MKSGFPAANYDYCIQKNSQNLQAITITGKEFACN